MQSADLLLPLAGLAVLSLVMLIAWARQRRTRNAGLVDVIWAGSLGALAVFYALIAGGWGPRRALVAVLAGLWSARLTLYLAARVKHEDEDGRYARLREELGGRFDRWMAWFFQAQALLAVLLSLAFLAPIAAPAAGWRAHDLVAVLLWVVAMAGESLADRQLHAWRADPANVGRTCRAGLWRYSRHPNYFFEWIHWLAYPVLSIGLPYGWAVWLAPALMLYLVLKVTGVPPTEERALQSRGEDYRDYQRTTNAFFPGPRKAGSEIPVHDVMKAAIRMVEKGLVPKPLLRHGIRRLLRERLREQERIFGEDRSAALRAWVEGMRGSPVALVPEKANEQHYELPPEFFHLVLGPRLKYSSAYYPKGDETLAQAEEAMLELTASRAELRDGQDVLELGCGWGSLTLWMAERYPNSSIMAVSNSAPQREHILLEAQRRGLDNLSVITCDMNDLEVEGRFDRIVSVEMFEHMRNWEELLGRAAGWLQPDGRLFLHFFAHRHFAYPFEVRDESDWMSRWFFSGGMMPCYDLVDQLDAPLVTDERWLVSGRHYARTSEHWLEELERKRPEVMKLFRETFGEGNEQLWYQRWRLFFLACAELFGYRDGQEWVVCHTLLRPRSEEESAS